MSTQPQTLTFVAKLAWQKKTPTELMTIRNFEAMRLMCQSIIHEKADQWDQANAARQQAGVELETELREYLSGIKQTVSSDPYLSMTPNAYGSIL